MSRTGQQDSVSIAQISSIIVIRDVAPAVATEVMIVPARAIEPKITVPRHADTIQFQSLHLKFRGGIFEVKT